RRKGLQKIYHLRSKTAGFAPVNRQSPHDFLIEKERNGEKRLIAKTEQDRAHPSCSKFVLLAKVGNLVRYSCFRCSAGSPLAETQRSCLIGIHQFLFHLVAGTKVKLSRGHVVFVDNTAISSGELNRPADDRAKHRLE